MIIRSRRSTARIAFPLLVGVLIATPALAGSFTADQAAAGEAAYNSNCAQCHGRQLQGLEAPAMAGPDVMQNWYSAGGLYDFISVAMPPSAPGKLGEETYLDIIAYVMAFNGATPGDKPLTADADLLHEVLLEAETSAGTVVAPAVASVAVTPAADSTTVPQAFTWGQSLPGGVVPVAPVEAPVITAKPAVPQAFTWGKKLPTIGATEPPVSAPEPSVPQAYTWGQQLPFFGTK